MSGPSPALAAHLIYHTDQHIEEHHAHRHNGIRGLPVEDEGKAKGEYDAIHGCEDILAYNLERRSAGSQRGRVAPAVCTQSHTPAI